MQVTATDAGGRQLRAQLGDALRKAVRDRDTVAAATIRTAMAAIDNAEAVSMASRSVPSANSAHVAGAAAGLGAAEVARRVLSADEATAIVRAEMSERLQAADQYAKAGSAEHAARLRAQAEVLRTVLSGPA